MHSLQILLAIGALSLGAQACTNPNTNACASAFANNLDVAKTFCATSGASAPAVLNSACESKASKLSAECTCFFTAAPAPATSSSAGAASSTATATSSASKTTLTTVTSKPASTTTPPTPTGSYDCTVTAYAGVAAAVKTCKNILLNGVAVPASSTLNLALATGAALTFAGKTTFGDTPNADYDPIVVSGTDITVTGAAGHVIDGNGQAYWDGLGSNGGTAKPDHFFVVKKAINAKITNLNIQNWPVHCFYISGAAGLTIDGLNMDNSAGDAPNSKSGSLAAAHNSDGFDISGSDAVTVSNTKVVNQDDCVAVTSGSNILVTGMYCSGGHGLSIGSVGGKSNNTVDGVTFSNSQIVNSQNGCRIKTNSGTTGTVNDVTYSNISLSGITNYGIDVQQDYLNGGPTGIPTTGVPITNLKFLDVTGTVTSSAYNYYILCGSGSCSGFTFQGTSITGGKNSCNYPSSACTS
ncbi:unnamed protein product [Discula destructiva]